MRRYIVHVKLLGPRSLNAADMMKDASGKHLWRGCGGRWSLLTVGTQVECLTPQAGMSPTHPSQVLR